ncbi:MAG: hypothetical protein AAB074_04620 [Planctomycetota bacterium]
MKRFLPAVPLVAFFVAALATLGRLEAFGALGGWALTAALEGATVALFWGGALGLGRLAGAAVLGRGPDPFDASRAPAAARFALEGGLGFAALMTALHLLGLAGLIFAPVVVILLLGGCVAALVGRDLKSLPGRAASIFSHPGVAIAAPLVAVLLVAASFPPGMLWPSEAKGYDALEYHLQVPREWLASGAIRALPHNLYGYLPLNFEMLTLGMFSLRGGAFEGMLGAQWLHASFAVGTAALLGLWAGARAGSPVAGAAAAATYLCVPWNLVTGSLAYNEQAAAFLGLGALVLLWEGPMTHRVMAAAGLCAGAAVGTKLTAAGFLFLPALAAAAAFRDREPAAPRTPPKRLALAALVFCAAGLLVHAPYLVRNAAWTGNPVFPFATRVLGRAHWGETQEWRFINGHFPRASAGDRVTALWKSGVGDPGYGFAWLAAVLAGLGLALSKRPTRALAAGAGVFALMQILFWISATHLQPRFLQPLTIPLAFAAGLGAAAIPARFAWPAVSLLAIGHTAWHGQLLWRGAEAGSPPTAAVALAEPMFLAEKFEGLKGHKALLVAEARAFYVPGACVYADPFETSPFARFWRAAGGDPAKALAAMRASGITLVIANWDEAERLKRTYGLDPEITRGNFERLVGAGAKRLESPDPIVEILELSPR